MWKTVLLTIPVLITTCVPGTAEIPPVVDGMGIYFDTEAVSYCVDFDPVPGLTPLTAYLLLINASTDQPDLLAWEARLVIDANPTIPVPSSWLLIGAINNLPPPCEGNDCLVGVDLPITNPITVLASITLSYLGTETDPYCVISIGPTTNSMTFPDGPGYVAETNTPIAANPVVGTWGEPSAWINHPDGPCDVVTNESLTWGAVKSLYED